MLLKINEITPKNKEEKAICDGIIARRIDAPMEWINDFSDEAQLYISACLGYIEKKGKLPSCCAYKTLEEVAFYHSICSGINRTFAMINAGLADLEDLTDLHPIVSNLSNAELAESDLFDLLNDYKISCGEDDEISPKEIAGMLENEKAREMINQLDHIANIPSREEYAHYVWMAFIEDWI